MITQKYIDAKSEVLGRDYELALCLEGIHWSQVDQ